MTTPIAPEPRCRNGLCVKMSPGLCRPCADRAERWLDELPGYVATLTAVLDMPCCPDHAAPPPPRGARGALDAKAGKRYEPSHPNPARAGDVRPAAAVRVAGSGERPLPGGADRLSWLARGADVSAYAGHRDGDLQTGLTPVGPALAAWVRLAAEELGVHLPPGGRVVSTPDGPVRRTCADDVPELAAFLARWHGEVVKQPWSDDYAAELHDLWSVARRLTGEAEHWVRIGACIAEVDGESCGEPLAVRPGEVVICCAGCDAEWPRERWLMLGAALRGIPA